MARKVATLQQYAILGSGPRPGERRAALGGLGRRPEEAWRGLGRAQEALGGLGRLGEPKGKPRKNAVKLGRLGKPGGNLGKNNKIGEAWGAR
jgi:hypothetical protein